MIRAPRLRAALLGAAALLLARPLPGLAKPEGLDQPRWTLAQLDALAETVAAHGYAWPALVERLQVAGREELLGGFAALEHEPAAVAPPPGEDLILLSLPAQEAAALRFAARPARVASLIPARKSPRCGRRIVRVEIEGEGAILRAPGLSATLPADRRGSIELVREVPADPEQRRCASIEDEGLLPPATIETGPEQAALRAALGLAEPR